ncbi:MAG TPA: tetratricopeptide repeat protein [Treponemataceae bacterium]|nr:tetratricopeptide repeat protein [Treponemataceae bacterium]HQL03949.1 tetratricopeptide repeat protein [Treponemataceae bacterium]
MKNIRSNSSIVVRKKTKILARIIVIFLFISLVAASVYVISKVIIRKNNPSVPTNASIISLWNKSEYEEVYTQSGILLDENSFNGTALFYRGLSSFYLAVSQTETSAAQSYLDESINNLRIALHTADKNLQPQISYILGKAYFQRNLFSSYHYYADLAVSYLEKAVSLGYESADIPEYLGLSYANLGMTQQSIEAFTNALLVRESDILLLAIAQQYIISSNIETAKQYLFKVAKESSNDILILKSKLLLAQIYFEEQLYSEAAQEYMSILEKDPDYADAYYGLGLIYEKEGDSAKARAEWRNVLKIQVNHQGAINKLGL